MTGALVEDPSNIRIAMLGRVDGNGHPYSWSAILNGYDREAMARCPFTTIPDYLSQAPRDQVGLAGVKVTHIWCDSPYDAHEVAQAALIPHVVGDPLEVIGQVDAVIIPTDKGEEHLERARPFIEAGLPVFIDKPLTVVSSHLAQFVRWKEEGRAILSSSCMRYSVEYRQARESIEELGRLGLITMVTSKSWERYGIHALEGVYGFLEPGGWLDVANTGSPESNLVHLRHSSGTEVVLAAIHDLNGSFGVLNLFGSKGAKTVRFEDTFTAFRNQLLAFVDYLRTGIEPFPFSETVEQMRIIMAGMKSRDEGGDCVRLKPRANESKVDLRRL